MTPPSNAELPMGDAGRVSPYFSPESVWSSRTQWGAILIGAFAGFAVFILMSTLGAALGITAGAIGVNTVSTVNADTAEKAATAYSIGAAIWMLLTALVVGLAGGWALNATARRDRPYSSFIFGGVCWAVGVGMSLLLAAPAVGGTASGLGGGAGAAAAGAAAQPGMISPMMPRTTKEAPGAPPAAQRNPAPSPQQTPMSDEEKAMAKDAAEKAANAATGAAWVILGSQLISIAATIFAAGWHRHAGAKVVTEIRMRAAPTA